MSFGKIKSPPPPTPPPPPPTPPSQADVVGDNTGTGARSFTSMISTTPTGLATKARTGKRSLIGGA